MIIQIEEKDAQSIKYIVESALGYQTTTEMILERIAELSHKDHYYIHVYKDDVTH